MSMKRGQSTVISTVLIILFVIALVVIVSVIVINFMNKSSSSVSTSDISLSIVSARYTSPQLLNIVVERGQGNSQLKKIKFILHDSSGVAKTTLVDASTLNPQAQASYNIDTSILGLGNLTSIDVAAIVIIDGQEKELGAMNSFSFRKESPGSSSYCTSDVNCTSGNYCFDASNHCNPCDPSDKEDNICCRGETNSPTDCSGSGFGDGSPGNPDDGNTGNPDPDASWTPTTNLVAYYPFDGNANDASGNGKNGQIVGSVNCNVNGRIGKACNNFTTYNKGTILLDNTNKALGNFGANDFSISFWINVTNFVSSVGESQYILDKGYNQQDKPTSAVSCSNVNTHFTKGYALLLNRTGMIGFAMNPGPYPSSSAIKSSLNSLPYTGSLSDITLTANKWQQVTYVFDRTNKNVKIYLDGHLGQTVDISNFDGVSFDNNVSLRLGTLWAWEANTYPTCAVNFYPLSYGSVDDLRIYNRALTGAQVNEILNLAPQTTPQVGSRIFVTNSVYNGNLGGVSGADAKCMADANKPSDGTGVWKALIFSSTRSTTSSGWVLKPNRLYKNIAGNNFGSTDSNSFFTNSGFQNSLASGSLSFWSGYPLSGTTNPTEYCNDWISSSNSNSGWVGIDQVDFVSPNYPLMYFSDDFYGCHSTYNLLCVEQDVP